MPLITPTTLLVAGSIRETVVPAELVWMIRTEDAPAAAVRTTAIATVRATRCIDNLRTRLLYTSLPTVYKPRMRPISVFLAMILALVCAHSTLHGQGTPAAATGPRGLDFETFRTKIEPIFLAKRGEHARCYACHAQGTPLRLQEMAPGATSWSEQQSRANFAAMQRVV